MVEVLTNAPPLGIHHHYCRLAVVTFPSKVDDCRVLWPPDFSDEDGCGCTVCVSAAEHNNGTHTIQQAIEIAKRTGGTVCLGPGVFHVTEPIRIDTVRNIACQPASAHSR